MGHRVHLTLREREGIMMMRRDSKGVSEIARSIGRDKSTVSRELKRNSRARFYRALTARRRCHERRLARRRRRALDDGPVFALVADKLFNEQWSPEQIEGRLALELGASPVSDTRYTAPSTSAASTPASAVARPEGGSGTAESAAAGRRSAAAESRPRTRYPSARRAPTTAASQATGRATRSPARRAARAF